MSINTPEYINGPYLVKNKVLYRQYQKNVFFNCKNKNSLVVLPTGLGKTIIGILHAAHCLKKYKSKGKVIILAPTRPLVSQHKSSCEKFLDINNEEITLFTGIIPPEKRILRFNESRIIISTPQVIKNDLIRGRYDLSQVALIIFDEAHKTKGNYAYNFISKEYISSCTDPLILGLTASPGKDYNHIQLICDNLYIENIVFKTLNDQDVKDFIHGIDTFIERVDLPVKYIELCEVWNHLFKKFLRFFTKKGLINPHKSYYSKLDFLHISHDLTLSLKYDDYYETEKTNDSFLNQLYYQSPKIIDIVRRKNLNIQSIYSYCSSCISILHAKDLLETQEISLFRSFIEKLKFKAEQGELSAIRILNSKHFQLIDSIINKEGYMNFIHPKVSTLFSIIKNEFNEFNNKKIIIFTQYREMAEFIKSKCHLEFSDKVSVEKFIGQASKINDIGFPQYKQIEILNKFREDKINILIATSVAEEGLDIPNVDAIIFYEPIPSEIRLIQRRGRTGRSAPGRCYILITENTVDVPFYIVARRKETTMNSILNEPGQLNLCKNLKRKEITFSSKENTCSELDVIKNFKKRKELEKEILANRSIEEIITQIDNFAKDSEFKKLKNYGISFFSDIIKIDTLKLRKGILKLKGKKESHNEKPKRYLNRNLKTLINIAKNFSEEGKISFPEFQELAHQEEILDQKFRIHFYQACHLGYLKKDTNYVYFLKDFN